MEKEDKLNNSVFRHRTVQNIYEEIQTIYLQYPQPWVIGYSGGKDSTAVLQLVWKALEQLEPEKLSKPVFVISSDTLVETPVIVDLIDNTLRQINEKARERHLPFYSDRVTPELNDTFWINLIGRGYPAPTVRFRWCTERLKIKPANQYIEQKVAKYGEVIMVLGVRNSESSTRMQLMNSYQVHGHILRRHSMLPGAFVYAPIADFSTDDVWTFLLQVPSPWGGNNRDLAALYRNASAGECPLVIDTSTPSCGNSRFGCWVCTVAQKDSSMAALIDSGEEWMEPLLEFRQWLADTGDPEKKLEFRDIRGRDGRVIIKKDKTLAARTFKLTVSKQMLEKVLQIQKQLKATGPGASVNIISEKELKEIRRLWRTERHDWEDSVPKIFHRVHGYDLEWPIDDNVIFDEDYKTILETICAQQKVPFELVAKLMETERQSWGLARRGQIQKQIDAILSQEWRDTADILADKKLKMENESK